MAGFMQNSMGNNPKISPPPVEVGIRTMVSDIEAIKASGGQPQFIGTQIPKIKVASGVPTVLWVIGGVLLAAIFAAIGYFIF